MNQSSSPSLLALLLATEHPLRQGLASAVPFHLGNAPSAQHSHLGRTAVPWAAPCIVSPVLQQQLFASPTLAHADKPKWIHVTRRFEQFQANLKVTANQVTDGKTKYGSVVSCLNAAYWGHNSSCANSFLIGSWAKDTRIRPPRDVDLYFLLPIEVYRRFEEYRHGINKQSALLQEVRSRLQATFPRSTLKGDGPVVIAAFDSYDVEVVPAFLLDRTDSSFWVCDTKNGGSYKKAMPLHEVDAIAFADTGNNSNVRQLVRMLKCWQAYCTVPIKSFHLELLVIQFLDQWVHRQQSFLYYDWLCRDFFAWLITRANSFLMAPGTFEIMWIGETWKSRAVTAHNRAEKACQQERLNDMLRAGDEWQKIFGPDIPRYV